MIGRIKAAYLRWRLRHVWADISGAQADIQRLQAQRAAWLDDAAAIERALLNNGAGL